MNQKVLTQFTITDYYIIPRISLPQRLQTESINWKLLDEWICKRPREGAEGGGGGGVIGRLVFDARFHKGRGVSFWSHESIRVLAA